MGVGQVLVATDGRIDQTGESSPASVSRALGPGMLAPGRAAQSYGERTRFLPQPVSGVRPRSCRPCGGTRSPARGRGSSASHRCSGPPCSTATPTGSPRSRRWACSTRAGRCSTPAISAGSRACGRGPPRGRPRALGLQSPAHRLRGAGDRGPGPDARAQRSHPEQPAVLRPLLPSWESRPDGCGLRQPALPPLAGVDLVLAPAPVPALRRLRRATGHHLARRDPRPAKGPAQRRPDQTATRELHPRAPAPGPSRLPRPPRGHDQRRPRTLGQDRAWLDHDPGPRRAADPEPAGAPDGPGAVHRRRRAR